MVGSPIGSLPSSIAMKSSDFHLISLTPSRGTMALPSVRAFGPPGLRLSNGSRQKGSGSRFSLIASIAFCAVVSSTAATARIGSPTKWGSFVRMLLAGPCCLGTSSAVSMAMTPSMLSASAVSMARTRAWGIGLLRSRQKSIPSARKSSAYLALPVTFARMSGGVKSLPIRSAIL